MPVVPDTYRVYSKDRLTLKACNRWIPKPNQVPAGEYRSLNRAIEHAETVTYEMVVLNWRDEIVHTNQNGRNLNGTVPQTFQHRQERILGST